MSFPRSRFYPVLALAASCALGFLGAASKAETVWWEAEQARETNMEVQPEVAASGGKWLAGNVQPGLFAQYELTFKDGGRYNLFARRNWLHGAFRWRVDDGEWVVVQGLKQTVVDQVKGAKGPISWVDLGYVNIPAGTHQLRIEGVTETQYPFNKIYGFDCFALTNDGFMPKGDSREGGPRQLPPKMNEAEYGRWIPRTMALLESATPTHRTPVNILFYGQSIIANSFIDRDLGNFLKAKYPNADFKITNLAIGGYEAPVLRKTAWQDLYPKNPDLIVFHVYGGENGELEEIYRNIKTQMTAEVLTWTHHVDNFGTGIDQQRDASVPILKSLAAKYGFEIVDVRALWKEYLKETHVGPETLLRDQIHLGAKGTELLKTFLVPHFRTNPEAVTEWKNRVVERPLAVAPGKGLPYDSASWAAEGGMLVSRGTQPLKLSFYGNRVDLVGGGGSNGSARILLDGTAPSVLRDTLAATRSTLAPGSWWPAISRVSLASNAVAEQYTATFHDVAPDGSSFAFEVKGSVSGDEGSGQSGADFVARSGRFSIAAGDIALKDVKKITRKDLPAQFTVEWSVASMSQDRWKPTDKSWKATGSSEGVVPQATVIRCWTDGPHTLEICPNGDGPLRIQQAIIFSPGGKASNTVAP